VQIIGEIANAVGCKVYLSKPLLRELARLKNLAGPASLFPSYAIDGRTCNGLILGRY